MKPAQTLSGLRNQAGYRWRFAERHSFTDRSCGAERMLVIIAGHKPLLWPWTLPRMAAAVPEGMDVCLVTPGVQVAELESFAEREGWSYLSTSGGHVSVAQNLAIRAHPAARWIFKIDEDVFVPERFFDPLLEGYRRVQDEAEFRVGFCAPVLNVNGFSYVEYLRTLGIEDEYAAEFGSTRRASDGIPAQASGEAASWLWSHGLPVEATAARFAAQPFAYSIVPHRFSIGAILFERELWDEMRGFKRLERSPGLGEDEQHICVTCLSRSKIMVVLHSVYAGHFAFGPQMPRMQADYESRLADF